MTPDPSAPITPPAAVAPPSGLSSIQQALLSLAAPFLLSIWNSIVYPELQKLEGKISSPDLKLVAETVEVALNNIVQAEVPKI